MDDRTNIQQRLCSVNGCGSIHYAKNYCSKHYVRLHRKSGQCSIEGCDRNYYGKGHCKHHYMKDYRHGDPHFDAHPRKKLAYVKDGIGYIPLTRGLCMGGSR
jgi:hypothetical protein